MQTRFYDPYTALPMSSAEVAVRGGGVLAGSRWIVLIDPRGRLLYVTPEHLMHKMEMALAHAAVMERFGQMEEAEAALELALMYEEEAQYPA